MFLFVIHPGDLKMATSLPKDLDVDDVLASVIFFLLDVHLHVNKHIDFLHRLVVAIGNRMRYYS